MPRVTVLMPVYNGAAYVTEAVRSVLAQTFVDFELLVVDDGSTDGSAALVDSLADARVRIVRNESNLGLTPTLNRGLALARGELIARQDADDLSAPDRLAAQVRLLDDQPDIALVGSWYRKIGATGALLGERRLPEQHALLRWALLFYCPFVHSAVVFRRHIVVDELSGYDERFAYAQDYDLWSRVAERCRVTNVPRSLVDYRHGPATMTATLGAQTDEVLRIACRNLVNVGAAVPTPAEHAAMGALMVGDADRLVPNAILPALGQLLDALEHFTRASRLGAAEIEQVRAAAIGSVATVLVAHASSMSDREYVDARESLERVSPFAVRELPASRRLALLRRAVSRSWIGRVRGTATP